ncbi:MAG: anti-sigma B factor antagonist [Flavobacteriales bacterium]|jgi:anti-sigma B factor antagonist
MPIKSTKEDSYTVVTVNLEKLDSIIAPDLKTEFVLLEKSGVNNIIVDLSEAKYCDSSGLSALLVGNRLLKTKGKFVICGLQPNVKKLIEISQLHTVLNICDDLVAAKELF